MTFPVVPHPDPAADHEYEQACRNPDRDTLLLAAAGAAVVPRQNLVQPIGCPLDSHWHGRLGAGQQR